MPQSKTPAEQAAAPPEPQAQAQQGQQSGGGSLSDDFKSHGFSFASPGGEEPELHVATYGDEGDDPLEAGFVGVKPKDEPGTVENSIKAAQSQ